MNNGSCSLATLLELENIFDLEHKLEDFLSGLEG